MPEFECGDECTDLAMNERVTVVSVGDLEREGWYVVSGEEGDFYWIKGARLALAS